MTDTSENSDESEVDWQKCSSGRNKRTHPLSPSQNDTNKRRAFAGSISFQNSSNRFEALKDVNEGETVGNVNNNSNTNVNNSNASNQNNTNSIKPPPIFIPDVSNISAMISDLKKNPVGNEFSYKALRGAQVKVMSKNVETYRAIVNFCKTKKINYHTYQVKSDKSFRVVVKKLHYSTPISEIKEVIEGEGHKVRQIVNVKHRVSKNPLNLFYVDLEPNSNNKDIYEIGHINQALVEVEPPHKTDDVIQCHRCQEFGHSKAYCNKPYNCVKCGQGHSSADCKKTRDTPACCVHCNMNHPANYRGCQVYQKLLGYKRNLGRQTPLPTFNLHSNQNNMPRFNNNNNNNNGQSYSEIAKGTNSAFQKLEALITKQIEMTSTLLNMIGLLIEKLCK